MVKHSAQLSSGNIVIGILIDSLGRVPDSLIELNLDKPDTILGYKYDSSAEESSSKTSASFIAPSEGKFFNDNGDELDLP